MSTAAPRPRPLKRQVSEARRNAESSGNARKHRLYARLHLLTPEETEALQLHIQRYLDSPYARNPAAVPILKTIAYAAFQQRRALGLETAVLSQHGLIPTGVALRLWNAIGVFESRYGRLFFRSLDRFRKLILSKQTPEVIEKKAIAQIENPARGISNSRPGDMEFPTGCVA